MTRNSLPRDTNHVAVMGGVSSADGTTILPVEIDPSTGNVLMQAAGAMINSTFDYIGLTPGGTTDVYAFKIGGSSGLTVNTLTIVYTDSTKSVLSSITKT